MAFNRGIASTCEGTSSNTATVLTSHLKKAGSILTKSLVSVLKASGIQYKGEPQNLEISSIVQDSRKSSASTLFVAIEGLTVDGHDFVTDAVKKGCRVIIAQQDKIAKLPDQLMDHILLVEDTRLALARISNAFYNFPARKVKLIGVTGTNGKTTTCRMIQNILMFAGYKVGYIGTIGYYINDEKIQQGKTTPDADEIFELLHTMVEAGCQVITMEVSSHALALKRIEGLSFISMAFTNLSQDHLDLHGTMKDYFLAKLHAFDLLTEGGLKGKLAVLNRDMDLFEAARKKTRSLILEMKTYGMTNEADYYPTNIEMSLSKTSFMVNHEKISFPVALKIPGIYNVSNALAAISCLRNFHLPSAAIQLGLAKTEVPGRLQRVEGPGEFSVFVDYAHTPDALVNVLKSLRQIKPKRIITVFGCGGDRDRTKRAPMGKAVVSLSDSTIMTCDNPRTEDPNQILDDVEEGVKELRRNYERILNREEAIARAINLARPGYIILIAGKGHETYQILGKETIHFDDVEIARKYLQEWKPKDHATEM